MPPAHRPSPPAVIPIEDSERVQFPLGDPRDHPPKFRTELAKMRQTTREVLEASLRDNPGDFKAFSRALKPKAFDAMVTTAQSQAEFVGVLVNYVTNERKKELDLYLDEKNWYFALWREYFKPRKRELPFSAYFLETDREWLDLFEFSLSV